MVEDEGCVPGEGLPGVSEGPVPTPMGLTGRRTHPGGRKGTEDGALRCLNHGLGPQRVVCRASPGVWTSS